MGIVYAAEDPILNRPLAIKVLPPKKLTEALLHRFQREAQAVARLDSPFIVRIYDFGQQEDITYIVMEFVEGETLGERYRGKPNTGGKALTERLQIFWQVLHAMAYAHDQGVIHRDIKPDNIMVTPTGRIKVMDFGLAFFADSHSLTEANQIMGTVAYFAPEQARGSKDIDHRADIYALGVVLFELLTGKLPFDAHHPVDMMRKLLDEEPRKVCALNPLVPRALEKIVDRALRKEPRQRYQSVNEMKAELERFLSSDDVAGLDPYAAPVVRPTRPLRPEPPPRRPETPEPEPPNPFSKTADELAPPQEEEAINKPGPGMTSIPYFQPLAPSLASDSWVQEAVEAHREPMNWEGERARRDDEIQHRLTPDRPEGPRVRCGAPDCGASNPPGRENCVECGAKLEPTYYLATREARAHCDAGNEALLQGRVDEARLEFQQAIKKNPEYGEAYLGLGKAHLVLGNLEESLEALEAAASWLDDDPEPFLVQADLYQQVGQPEDVIECLNDALELAPRDGDLRCRLAFLHHQAGAVEEAMRQYRIVLRYEPQHLQANRQLGLLLAADEKVDEAIHYLEIACNLDPTDANTYSLLGRLYTRTRRYRSAEDAIIAALEQKGDDASLRTDLGFLYQTQNRSDLAARELQKALQLDHGHREARLALCDIYLEHGQHDHALNELNEALVFHPQDVLVHRRMGEIYLQKRDLDRAMEHFEKVVALDPECAEMRNRLGRIYLKKNYDDLSIEQYEEAVKLHSFDPVYREDLGMAYYCAGRFDDAINELHKAATLDGQNPDYFKALGMLYYQGDQDEEAVRHLKWSLHLSPNDAQARGMLGQALVRQGLANLAVAEYERALELDPSLQLLHLYKARAAAKGGKHGQAIQSFRQFAAHLEKLEDTTLLGQAYVEMGFSYLANGDPARAAEVFQAALSRDPQEAGALRGLAEVAIARGNLKLAEEHVKSALALEPRGPAVLETLASLMGEKGQWNEAVRVLEKAVVEAPTNAVLHEKLGRAMRKAGNLEGAVQIFQRAGHVFPKRRGHFLWLEGRALGRSGRWGEAAHQLRKALDENPHRWEIYEDLAQACARLGEFQEAVTNIKAAISKAPEGQRGGLNRLLQSIMSQQQASG